MTITITTELIINIVIGALCGWIACILMNSKGGIIWYIITGIIGGALGNWIAGLLHVTGGKLVSICAGILGTCLLIGICRLIFKK